MKILTKWLRAYLPGLPVDDAQLAEDLTLRGIAVEGIYPLGEGNGSLYEMDITTNRVDAMNHYGVARETAAIYGLTLPELQFALPKARPCGQPFSVKIEAEDGCGRFTARVLRDITIGESRDWFAGAEVSTYFGLLEQKKISNAVDATNFAWLAMGQPTHAFDLDKIKGGIVQDFAAANLKDEFRDIHPLCFSCRDRGVLHAKRAIQSIADIKDLKLHVQNPLAAAAMAALGAQGVPMPVPQVPMALTQHVIVKEFIKRRE